MITMSGGSSVRSASRPAGQHVDTTGAAAHIRVTTVRLRRPGSRQSLAGHNQTATTELIYLYQIVPALTRGAEVMDQIFG